MVTPTVSIIIVNYSGRELLEECLKSIFKQTDEDIELIVVDNNSTDDSVNFIEKNYPNINLLKLNKNFGFAVPNNMASKIARGKYLVFLNNDTIVTQNWLSQLLAAMESDKTIAMGQSLLLHPDGTVDSSGDFIDSLGRAYSSKDIPKKSRYVLSPRAACMIVRKDIFLELGGFDESYFASFEDVELGWKSWLWGYKVILVPTSIVFHHGGKTVKSISKTISFHGVKNNLLLRSTNFDFFDRIKSIFLISIIIFFKKFFRISIVSDMDSRFDIPDFNTLFRASIWILKNSNKISNKRKILKSKQIRTNNELKKMGLITKFHWT